MAPRVHVQLGRAGGPIRSDGIAGADAGGAGNGDVCR